MVLWIFVSALRQGCLAKQQRRMRVTATGNAAVLQALQEARRHCYGLLMCGSRADVLLCTLSVFQQLQRRCHAACIARSAVSDKPSLTCNAHSMCCFNAVDSTCQHPRFCVALDECVLR